MLHNPPVCKKTRTTTVVAPNLKLSTLYFSDTEGSGFVRQGPGTVALRQRMDADAANNNLASPATYLDFLLTTDAGISRASAHYIVRRELQRRQ